MFIALAGRREPRWHTDIKPHRLGFQRVERGDGRERPVQSRTSLGVWELTYSRTLKHGDSFDGSPVCLRAGWIVGCVTAESRVRCSRNVSLTRTLHGG